MKLRVIFLTLFISLFLAGFIPVTINSFFIIDANLTNVYQSLNNPRNWLKWLSTLKKDTSRVAIRNLGGQKGFEITAPSFGFTVLKNGLTQFNISAKGALALDACTYTIIPDSAVLKTIIYTNKSGNVFGWLKNAIGISKPGELLINDLKTYMESPELYYGYRIEKQITRDKQLIIKRRTILKNDVLSSNKAVLKTLDSVAADHNLKEAAPLQLQYLSSVGDSVQVIVGLPVNKKIVAAGGIENMGMPGGKILTGWFSGKYRDRKKLYRAMQLYITDNYLHTQTLPLERFNQNRLPANDSSVVHMQVIIPYL